MNICHRYEGVVEYGDYKCTRCNETNEYAVPNQPDGSFKCYGCRQPGICR